LVTSSKVGNSTKLAIENPADERATGAYERYVVFLCLLAYIFSYVDRQILALLVGPVKADLNLTDTQFSLLHGLAFSLMYAFMGIPIARLSDRHSRPLIIAIGISVWSVATAACGISKNFWQLFVARMTVGVGEAALSPAAYSMFADLFPISKLGRVVGIYSIGAFLGAGLAFIIGGMVIDLVKGMSAPTLPLIGTVRAWQMVFFIVGIPGLLLALVMFLTVKEPERKDLLIHTSVDVDRTSLRETVRFIFKHKQTFLCHYLGFSFYAMALFAYLSWLPAFYTRNYALDATQTGYYLGVVVLLANTSGVYIGGYLSDFLHRKGNTDAPMYAGAIGAGLVALVGPWFALVGNLWQSLALIVPAMFFLSFPMPTSTAAMQVLAPNQMRAQVAAIFLFVSNLIGLGGGATLVALLTDQVFHNEKHVGYSVAIVVTVAGLLAALLLHFGRRYFNASLEEEIQYRSSN
jgi:MFS family permease